MNSETRQNGPVAYDVFNRITGKKTRYQSSRSAVLAMDRLDNAYGAVICNLRLVWPD